MKPWIIGIILVVLLASAAAGYFGVQSGKAEQAGDEIVVPPTVPVTIGDVQQTINAAGEVVAARQAELSMGLDGVLAKFDIKPGDTVKAGDKLASLANREDYEAELSVKKRLVLEAQQEVDTLIEDAPLETAKAYHALLDASKSLRDVQEERQKMDYPRGTKASINQAQADYQLARLALEDAERLFSNYEYRVESDLERINAQTNLAAAQKTYYQALANLNWFSGTVTQEEIDQADSAIQVAQAELDAAKIAWEKVKDGVESGMLQLAQAKLEEAQMAQKLAEANLEHLDLYAPFDGVVIKVDAQTGEKVTAGQSLLTLVSLDELEILIQVIEEDYPLVSLGQTVDLYFDAQPDLDLDGTVSRIVPQRSSTERPFYPVYLTLENAPSGIVPGMTVDTFIILDSRENVLTLPRSLVNARSDGTATIKVWVNDHEEKRSIRTGLRGDQTIEILEGLSEGELVIGR